MEGLDGVYISCDGSVFVGLVVLKNRCCVWERGGHGCGRRYGLGKGGRTKEAGATRGRKEKKRLNLRSVCVVVCVIRLGRVRRLDAQWGGFSGIDLAWEKAGRGKPKWRLETPPSPPTPSPFFARDGRKIE